MYNSDFLSIPQWEWTEAGVTAVCNTLNSVLSSYVDGGAATAKFKIKFWPVVDSRFSTDPATYMIKGTAVDSASAPMLIRIAAGTQSGGTVATGIAGYNSREMLLWAAHSSNGEYSVNPGICIVFGDSAFAIYSGDSPNNTANGPLFVAEGSAEKLAFYGYENGDSNSKYVFAWNPDFPSSATAENSRAKMFCVIHGWNTATLQNLVPSAFIVPFPVPGTDPSNITKGLCRPVQFSKAWKDTAFSDVVITSGDPENPAQKRYYTHQGAIFMLMNEVNSE